MPFTAATGDCVVKVWAARPDKLQAMFFTSAITLRASAVARYEAKVTGSIPDQLIAGRFRARGRDEGGFTLVIMSAVLVGLMGSAAMVLDFALVRSDRQHNKSAADMAVAAGVRAFNFDGVVAPFHGACAAIDYLKSNHSALGDTRPLHGLDVRRGRSRPRRQSL